MSDSEKPAFYTCLDSMVRLYDSLTRQCAYQAKTPAEHDAWKKEARRRLFEITGLDRVSGCDLLPEKLESVQMDGYRRDKLLIQTEPDVWMPFYCLVPDGLKPGERRPCMIAAHGHSSGGKYSIAGRTDIPAVKKMIDAVDYDYGVKFAKLSFIAFCHDARGFGERREIPDQSVDDSRVLDNSCIPLNNKYMSMGRALAGMFAWDIMRLIDYIATRVDCDASRIGCGGLSGGGLQTLWAAALDDRIACSVISGYFYGYKEALLMEPNHCACNFVPHLYETVDMGDMAAMIAPRPLLIESGTKDPLNGYRGVINASEQVDIARRAYMLFGAEDAIYHHIFEGEHVWHAGETYNFVKKWLKP